MNYNQIIIYGAGRRGKACYDFIKNRGKEDIIYAFCDRNWESIISLDGKKLYHLKKQKNIRYLF